MLVGAEVISSFIRCVRVCVAAQPKQDIEQTEVSARKKKVASVSKPVSEEPTPKRKKSQQQSREGSKCPHIEKLCQLLQVFAHPCVKK